LWTQSLAKAAETNFGLWFIPSRLLCFLFFYHLYACHNLWKCSLCLFLAPLSFNSRFGLDLVGGWPTLAMGCGFLHCEKLNFQERSDFELLVSGTKHEDGTLIANWSSNVSSGMKDATSWPESTCVGGLGIVAQR
jgi:hypothetical protein